MTTPASATLWIMHSRAGAPHGWGPLGMWVFDKPCFPAGVTTIEAKVAHVEAQAAKYRAATCVPGTSLSGATVMVKYYSTVPPGLVGQPPY